MSAVDVLSALIAPAAGAPTAAPGEADAPAFERALGLLTGGKSAAAGQAQAAAPGLLRTLAAVARSGASPAARAALPAAAPTVQPSDIPAGTQAAPAPQSSGRTRPALDQALDAFGQALKEALGPEDGGGLALGQTVLPDGTLPPEIQAALDKVVAAASPDVGARLQAMVARFLTRPGAEAVAVQPHDAALPEGASPAQPTSTQGPASTPALIAALRQAAGQGRTDARAAAPPTISEVEPKLRAARTAEAAERPAAKEGAPAPAVTAVDRPSPTSQPQTGPASATDKPGVPSPDIQALATAEASPDAAEPSVPGEGPTQAAAAPADARAAAAVAARGSPETVAHLAAQIVRRLEGRSTRFEIELHPNDLGAVDVRLEIGSDGRIAAQLAFDNPAAATDLRARADELRRMLEQAGFNVAEDALSFSEREAGGFERHAREQANPGRRRRAFEDGERTALDADTAVIHRRAVALGVDVRI